MGRITNVTLTVDASYCPDTGAAGWAMYVSSDLVRTSYKGQLTGAKNATAAEIQATVNALFLVNRMFRGHEVKRLFVNIDCMEVIRLISGGKNSSRNCYEASTELHKQQRILSGNLGHVKVIGRHVKAHTSKKDRRSIANELCDVNAKEQMRILRKKLKTRKK